MKGTIVDQALDDLTFRHPTMDDAQLVLELMETCEVSEYGESDSDLEDLTHDWGQINLAEDAWLACTSTSDLAGYGGLFPNREGFRLDLYVLPCEKPDALLEELLHRGEDRAHALKKSSKTRSNDICRTYNAHANRRQRKFFERHDYRVTNYHFQMHIQLDRALPPHALPESVQLRTMRPAQDERAIHTLIQKAFNRPGRTPQPFDEWKEFMMRREIFRPELWFLAVVGEEIIGICLCFHYGQLGWVRQLAVVEKWCRKGLGGALLTHAFKVFKERGCEKVELVVDADNPNAYRFYQSLGMKKMRQYDQYQKVIS